MESSSNGLDVFVTGYLAGMIFCLGVVFLLLHDTKVAIEAVIMVKRDVSKEEISWSTVVLFQQPETLPY